MLNVTANDVSGSDLADALGVDPETNGVSVIDDDDVVQIENVESIETFDVTFDESTFSAQNYTLEFEAVDTGATAEATMTVEDPGDTTVEFADDSVFTADRGDNAEIAIDLANYNNDQLNVTIGSEDVNYKTSAVIDVDEDAEEVVLEMNSYKAGTTDTEANAFEVTEGGQIATDGENALVTRHTDFKLSQPLAAISGGYDLKVASESEDRTWDRGTLRLNERTTEGITLSTAPGDEVDLADETVEEILDDASESQSFASGDVGIVQVEATGLYGYINDVEDFGPEHDVNLNITAAQAGPNAQATTYALNGDNIDGTESLAGSYYADEENSTFYVVFDADNYEVDKQWDVEFTVGENNDLVSEDDTAESSFQVVDREIAFDQEDYTVEAADGQNITGTATVAPGTQIEVDAEATGDNPFFKIVTAEVDENGEWTADFDFSGEAPGTAFDLSASDTFGGDAAAEDVEASGNISTAEEEPEPEPEFTIDTDAPSEVTVNESAELGVTLANDGDANGTTNLTVTVNGETVDDTTKELAAGEDASFSYNIPTSEAGDVSWEVTVDDDSASGTVTVAEEGDGEDGTDGEDGEDGTDGEDGEDGEDGTDGEDGEDGTDSEDGGDGSDGDAEGQPGFGVAVALVAMLAAAMLALRRQN
ncbi:BGTF surface domain-containing protein [Natribaculum luteum]|uniref:BGTF surface domain-containing protein n=1 Tax=Natribaculum luteum TaxID=1586232 RepID=UPI001FF58476|nr:BGTF surface domain-containing protein [Natribaculum luteum]